MLASNGLITAPCGEPCAGVHLSSPFRMSAFSQPRIRSRTPAIADLLLDPRHQPIMRDRIEIGGQVRVYDVGVAILDQPIDFPQRVMASAPRSEAVAPIAEPRFENRFDHEPDSLLDDAILDRRNAQRPHSSIALGNVDPFDGLRAVGSLRSAADSAAR